MIVPPGYVLVPIEPTLDMFVEGMEADCLGRPSVDDDTHVRSIWAAMLRVVALNCPACHGSGEGEGMEGRGPDTYTVTVPCARCNGGGVVR